MSEKWHEPYTAYEVPNDRLSRWMILGGTGDGPKIVVAEKIRTEAVARLFAAAPANRDKLDGIKEICKTSLEGVADLTAAQNMLRMIDAFNKILHIVATK